MRDHYPPRTDRRTRQHSQGTPQRRDSQAARPQEGRQSGEGYRRDQGEPTYSYRQGQHRGRVQRRQRGRPEQVPRQGGQADAPPPQGQDTRQPRGADRPGNRGRQQHRRRTEQPPQGGFQSGAPPQQGGEAARVRDDARRQANVRQPGSPRRRRELPRTGPPERQPQGRDPQRQFGSQRRPAHDQRDPRATNRGESTPPGHREPRSRQQVQHPGGQHRQLHTGSSPARGVRRERRGTRDRRGETDQAGAPTELVRLGRSDDDDEQGRGSSEGSSGRQEGSDSALPPRDPETGQFISDDSG